MSGTSLSRGDIVTINWQPAHSVDRASGALAPVSDVLALVENPASSLGGAMVWSPFMAHTGTCQFEIPQDRLKVIGHIRLLDAWTVSVHNDDRERRFTLPALIVLDGPRRLRVAFLTWCYEYGPLATQPADWETILFLSEM